MELLEDGGPVQAMSTSVTPTSPTAAKSADLDQGLPNTTLPSFEPWDGDA